MKELKNRFSHYMGLVCNGESIVITARGKAIAEIRAIGTAKTDDEACLAELERSGLATRGQGRVRAVTPFEMQGAKMLSDLYIEDRG